MNHTIEIQNLKCGGCANTVLGALNKIDNLINVSVNVEDGIVSFYSENDAVVRDVTKKLTDIGYPPTGSRNSVITKAKSYVSCATGKMKS